MAGSGATRESPTARRRAAERQRQVLGRRGPGLRRRHAPRPPRGRGPGCRTASRQRIARTRPARCRRLRRARSRPCARWLAARCRRVGSARRRAGGWHERRAPLAHVHARGDAADFGDRAAEQRLVDVGVYRREFRVRFRRAPRRREAELAPRRRRRGPAGPRPPVRDPRPPRPSAAAGTATSTSADAAGDAIQLPRLPGPQPALICSGNWFGSAAALKASGDEGGGLVVLAAARAVHAERDDHVRAERADVPDVVAKDLVLAPLLDSVSSGLKEKPKSAARVKYCSAPS